VKTSIRIASVPAEIRTEHLQNTSLQSYRYANLVVLSTASSAPDRRRAFAFRNILYMNCPYNEAAVGIDRYRTPRDFPGDSEPRMAVLAKASSNSPDRWPDRALENRYSFLPSFAWQFSHTASLGHMCWSRKYAPSPARSPTHQTMCRPDASTYSSAAFAEPAEHCPVCCWYCIISSGVHPCWTVQHNVQQHVHRAEWVILPIVPRR
jgi:hypothetical protein